MTTEHEPPLTTQWGTLYPKQYVVAIVTDEETARTARAALEAAGWAHDEVATLSGTTFLDRHANLEERQNLVERLGAIFASDERLLRDQYVDEANRGRSFLFVRAGSPGRAHQAARVVEPFRPTAVHYFGELATTELLPLSIPEGRPAPAERPPGNAVHQQE